MMLAPRALGVLGINRRNAEFVQQYNPRRYYPLVDDKLRSKQLAIDAGLAVPPLYASIQSYGERVLLEKIADQYEDFVIKPARGSGGDGIVVITGRSGRFCRLHDGSLIELKDLRYHIANILSGQYSLGGLNDKAMLEYRVRFDPIFESVAYQGVPDIRLIVFCGYPVMAMVRLPTRESRGKANLHQGAIGVGIDIASGRTLRGVKGISMIDEHPDTGASISGIHIPNWQHLLTLAAGCYELCHLGYLGVDIVLDKERGPLILELNARPGLNVQIANGVGLLPRLNKVPVNAIDTDVAKRVAFAKEHFCADV